MTAYYVRSGAAGAGTGADWTNAYTTMTTAYSGKAAGDIFYVSEDHAESTAGTVTLTSPGTVANPCLVYCVNHSGSVPPVSANLRTTGTIASSGANVINLRGCVYYYGLGFTAGSTLVVTNAASQTIVFEACALAILGAGTNNMFFGSVGSSIVLINTTVSFANASNYCIVAGLFEWRNTASAILGTLPTTIFGGSSANVGAAILKGVDLSALGSGKTLVGTVQNSSNFKFIDCKLGASVTIAATPQNHSATIDVVHSDSGATNYRTERYRYEGTQTVDTTIVRTGGATDGTTTEAWKIVTTANSKWVVPFESQAIALWNDSTSAINTLTIYGTTTGGGVPNNDDIWVDVEYLGSSLTPQGSFITTTKADNLAAAVATNNSSDASAWGGGGAGNGFKIVVPSFTPGQKGPLNITIKVAKASSTYYIDPKPSINGVSVSKSAVVAPGVYMNELASAFGRQLIMQRGTPY